MKLLILTLLFISSFQPIERNGCLKMDIILIGDISSSVSGYQGFVATAFDAFVDKFELSEDGVKIGVIAFEGSVYVFSELTSDIVKVKNGIDQIRDGGTCCNTNLSKALYAAMDEFAVNGRNDVIRIVVIVTDGDPDNKELCLEISNQMKNMIGVGVCGVLITSGSADADYLKHVSSDFCYVESNYENLVDELKRMDVCL